MKRLIKKAVEVGQTVSLKDLGFDSHVDMDNREEAFLYVNGEFLTGENHPEIVWDWMNDKEVNYDGYEDRDDLFFDKYRMEAVHRSNMEGIQDCGFGHLAIINDGTKCAFIEENSLQGSLTLGQFEDVIRNYYGDIPIFTTSSFNTNDVTRVAKRLLRKASMNLMHGTSSVFFKNIKKDGLRGHGSTGNSVTKDNNA